MAEKNINGSVLGLSSTSAEERLLRRKSDRKQKKDRPDKNFPRAVPRYYGNDPLDSDSGVDIPRRSL